MGTTLEQATAAGFLAWGVEFYPLSLRNYKAMDVWMQDDFRKQCLQTAREDGITGNELSMYMDSMLRVSAGLTCATPEGKARMESVDGMFYVLHLSSRGKFDREAFTNSFDDNPDALEEELDAALESLYSRVLALTHDPDTQKAGESNPTKDQ